MINNTETLNNTVMNDMSYKERADYLIKIYHPFTYGAVHYEGTVGEYTDAIQCAIRTVDQILQLKSHTKYPVKDTRIVLSFEEYWFKVKQELENYQTHKE